MKTRPMRRKHVSRGCLHRGDSRSGGFGGQGAWVISDILGLILFGDELDVVSPTCLVWVGKKSPYFSQGIVKVFEVCLAKGAIWLIYLYIAWCFLCVDQMWFRTWSYIASFVRALGKGAFPWLDPEDLALPFGLSQPSSSAIMISACTYYITRFVDWYPVYIDVTWYWCWQINAYDLMLCYDVMWCDDGLYMISWWVVTLMWYDIDVMWY